MPSETADPIVRTARPVADEHRRAAPDAEVVTAEGSVARDRR